MQKSKLIIVIFFLLLTILVVSKLTIKTPPSVEILPTESPKIEIEVATSTTAIIGSSVEGRTIETYTFGTGTSSLLFVGGVHGGYEWNSILLAYELIDYLNNHPEIIPTNITIHIIPNLNPDGLFAATGLVGKFTTTDIKNNNMHTSGVGRMNARGVDLNRNFDCKWAPESSWRNKIVSAGTNAFSEPEAQTLRDYVNTTNPRAAIFWHSMAKNVYASECEQGILPETLTLMTAYSKATSYGAVPVFDAYPITGDAEGWLASINIPAITVELGSRTSTEWEQNLAGVKAILNFYSK